MKNRQLFIILVFLIYIFLPGSLWAANQPETAGRQVQEQGQASTAGEISSMPQQAVGSRVIGTNQDKTSLVNELDEDRIKRVQLEEQLMRTVDAVLQERAQAQSKVQSVLQKAESRPGFLHFLLGPDFKALRTMNQQVEENRQRVQDLEQLQSQTQNENESNLLQSTIRLLNQENTSLEEKIQSQEKGFSLFGWLVKLLAK